ncbi:hypothetical protein SAMN05444145_101209 [Alistipes timonensis JC136]|uniref:Uncharacterized protein n=1 Tax=Alistipes timonensis JC136 TaxID=1033731 RepID=A0A1H3XGL8_9BACT|nr:hypothetical protein [Alistipes timonensis]SDZ98360.1 hypothetical protein SAMN05444145_101209 [Alistipes timonensis JC136]
MLLTALNLLVPIGVLVAAIDNRVFNAGCGEWLACTSSAAADSSCRRSSIANNTRK